MKYLKFIAFIFFLLIQVGCEDFLTEEDPSQITNSTFWKTADDAEQGLIATYSALKQTFLWSSQGIKNMNSRGDDIIARLQNPQIFRPDLFTNDPSNTFASNMWKNSYVLIFRANQVIDHVLDIDMDEERKKEIVLEAKFLRGIGYFVLATNFKQVPLVLTAQPEDMYPEKASVEELWNQIERDFSEAKELPEGYPSAMVGHATTWAARAFLGKTYLYRQKWQKAVSEFEFIINNGGFALVSDVYDNWGAENENNVESIFEIQYMYSAVSAQHNQATIHLAPAGVGGYFVLSPSEWIFEEFQKEKTIDGDFDSRMYATFVWDYDGAEIYQTPFNDFFEDDPDYVAWKKFQLWDKSVSEASLHQSEINFRIMRYSHVLLMYAEAQNELGNIQPAINAVNQIRVRAGLSELSSNLTQDEVREEIRHQRALEFHLEGERWYDIVRWGIGEEVFNNNLERPYSRKYDYFPIPQEEINANPNLTQNPEWN
jgi:hypothetical protein